MKYREWRGTVNGDAVGIQLVTDDDNVDNMWIDRDHQGSDGWNTHQYANVEERPGTNHRIWVAEFEGGDELLINLWDDRLTVASRGSFASWGPPKTFDEVNG